MLLLVAAVPRMAVEPQSPRKVRKIANLLLHRLEGRVAVHVFRIAARAQREQRLGRLDDFLYGLLLVPDQLCCGVQRGLAVFVGVAWVCPQAHQRD